MIHHIAFGVAALLREVFMVLMIVFLLTMVTYHMFPEGWLKAVVRQMRDGRTAYNRVFLDAYLQALLKSHAKKKLG